MASVQIKLEQRFFRVLNSIVEPAVRRGIFSSRLLPTTMIVLESTGYISGQARRTPLFCQQLGPYVLISTGRGKRSFWVRNLQRNSEVEYFMGGRAYAAQATVITADSPVDPKQLPTLLKPLARCLNTLTGRGWAFALLKTQ
jgi:hypothetical protein